MIHRNRFSFPILVIDILAIIVVYLVAYSIEPSAWATTRLDTNALTNVTTITIGVLVVWILCLYFGGMYELSAFYKLRVSLRRLFVAYLLAAIAVPLILLVAQIPFSWLFYGIFVTLGFVVLAGWRFMVVAYNGDLVLGKHRENVLIVGASDLGKQIANEDKFEDGRSVRVIGFVDDRDVDVAEIPKLGSVNRIHQIINNNKIEHVIITLPESQTPTVNNLLLSLADLPLAVYIPDFGNLTKTHPQLICRFGEIPFVHLRKPMISPLQRAIKRLVDMLTAIIAIVVTLPIMIVVAVAIKLDSRGPILIGQRRIGEQGRVFHMYKFRSMVENAENLQAQVTKTLESGEKIYKTASDFRITSVGRIIRRWSLDELAQLFNIFKGDMSWVGPRPELPWIVTDYHSWQYARFNAPQGLTGHWQTTVRSSVPLHKPEATRYDLDYICNYSLWFDIKIVFRTPLAVIKGKGAF